MSSYSCGILFIIVLCLARAGAENKVLMLEELPLSIIATQPSQLADQENREPVLISGSQAITVVFSRPVVSDPRGSNNSSQAVFFLEPDVPGNFTWSTSYIAHFSPEQAWPPESELKLVWYSSVSSFDGAILLMDTKTTGIAKVVTPNITVLLQLVVSDLKDTTDGGWVFSLGTSSDILPEVPPNARIFLQFSYPVSLNALRDHFQVYQDEQPVDLGLTVSNCSSPDDISSRSTIQNTDYPDQEIMCATVTLEKSEPGARFSLVLEAGVILGKNYGSLKEDLSVSFGGLRAFAIPFAEPPLMSSFNITHCSMNMWLPHGLSRDNTISDLIRQVTILEDRTGKEVKFNMSMEGTSVCRLHADFAPVETYRIQVSPSLLVMDGYGQPLQESSLLLSTEAVEPIFEQLRPRAQKVSIYESSMDWGRAVVALYNGGNTSDSITSCLGKNDIRAWSITPGSDSRLPLSILQSSTGKDSLDNILGTDDVLRLKPPAANDVEVIKMNVSNAIEEFGVLATEFCRSGTFSYHLLIETNMQVAVVAWGSENALMWITSMENARPIENATVRLYKSGVDGFQSEPLGVGNFTVVEKGRTDAAGKILVSRFSDGLHASVEYKGKLLYIPDVNYVVPQTAKTIYDVFMLDRTVLRPGETLLIHGYVVEVDGSSFQPSSTLVTPQLTISPALGSENQNSQFPLEVAENGGFTVSIPIPNGTNPSIYTVQFEAAEVLGSFEKFRVVKLWPVKPMLEVEAPEWVYMSSNVTVAAAVRSSIGVAIAGVMLNVSHVIVGTPHLSSEDTLHETNEIMVTDGEGRIKSVVDLSALRPSPHPGSILVSTVSWARDNEDVLEDKKISRLEVADLNLRIHRTVETNIPGQRFSVRVSATRLNGTSISTDAAVRLLDLGDWRAVARISDTPSKITPESNCTVSTGELDYNCRLSLPRMGTFALEACVETVCWTEPLGWEEPEWKKKPLDSHLKIGLVSLSKEPHSLQTRFKFAIENPYKNSSALLSWGSSIAVKHKIINLEDEALSEFSLLLGEECSGHCTMSAVVAVPRQPSLSVLENSSIPISNVFDPNMPHLSLVDLIIRVAQNYSTAVVLELPELGCCKAAAPGQDLTLTVLADEEDLSVWMHITSGASKRPTFDEEISQGLAERFNLDLSIDFTRTFSSDYLIAPKTEEVLALSFKERIDADPWAAAYADEFGMNVDSKISDLSIEDYLSEVATSITVIPDWLVEEEQLLGTQQSSEVGQETASPDIGLLPTREYNLSEVANGKLYTSQHFDFTSNGKKSRFTFTAPDLPGDYLINVYTTTSGAQGKGMRFGSGQIALRVHDRYSYNVTAPRFVRLNDTFDVSVLFGTLYSASVEVTVGEDSGDIFELDRNVNKQMGRKSHKTQVQFNVRALGLGNGSLMISAGGVEEEIIIDVLGKQDSVRYLTASRVSANDSSDFLPAVMSTAAMPLVDEQVFIHLGVGELPSFMSFLTDFHLRNHRDQCPLSADYLLSLVILHVVGQDYGIGDLDPSLLDNATYTAVQSNLDVTFALDTLESMTANTLGLRSVAFCQGSSESSLPKIPMNGKAAALVNLLNLFPNTTELMGEQYLRLRELSGTWKEAISRLVLSELNPEEGRPDPRILAVVRSGLGSDLASDNKDLAGKLGRILNQNLLKMDIASQAYYILAHDSKASSNQSNMDLVTKQWASTYQEGTRMGFIPNVHMPDSPTSYLGNALALVVLLRSNLTQPIMVHGLANFLRSPPLGQNGLDEILDIDRAAAMIALRLYDTRVPSPPPTEVSAVLNKTLKGGFNPHKTILMSVQLSGKKSVLEKKGIIEIMGEGELSVVALATVIPQTPHPNPLYQGIFIERSIYTTGPAIERVDTLPYGSVVTVVLQAVVHIDSENVVIDVPMPGGLEALQSQSGATQSAGFCTGRALDLEDLNCYVQEIMLSSVVFEFETLSKGTHEVQFSALATRLGEFFFPPSKAFVKSQPTHVGFSNSGVINICVRGSEGCSIVAVADEPDLPVACPDDCSGNGACDLRIGKCLCRFGFQSENCSVFSL